MSEGDDGVQLTLLSKVDVLQEEVDAIVVAIKADMPKVSGQLAWRALNAAGSAVSDVVEAHVRGRRLIPNEVEQFDGGALPCKFIMVVGLSATLQIGLPEAVYHTLVRATELQCETISIPAIGCGGFGYTAEDAADYIVMGVKSFLATYRHRTSLTEIRLLAYGSGQFPCFRRSLEESKLPWKRG